LLLLVQLIEGSFSLLMTRTLRFGQLCFFAALAACPALPQTTQKATEPVWKTYRNYRWGFCIDYPSNWVDFNEGFNKAGMSVAQSPERPAIAELGAGALSNQPYGLKTNNVDDNTPMTLEENVNGFLDIFGKKAQVLVRERMMFAGTPAFHIKVRHTDADGEWISEYVQMLVPGAVYDVNLRVRPNLYPEYEPVYRRFKSTFRLNCVPLR